MEQTLRADCAESYADVRFSLAAPQRTSIRFTGLPAETRRLIIIDGTESFEAEVGSAGALEITRALLSGPHTVGALPPRQSVSIAASPRALPFFLVLGCALAAWITAIVVGVRSGLVRWEGIPERPESESSNRLISPDKRRWGTVLLPAVLAANYLFLTRDLWIADEPNAVFRPSGWEDPGEAYEHFKLSQYVRGWSDVVRVMPDEQTYMFAGWLYAHGADPSLVNPEHPPLGKYLIGASARLFSNPLLLTQVFGLAAIVFMFFVARDVLSDPVSGFVCTAVFLNGRLFEANFSQPLLDVFVLTFLVFGGWLLLRLAFHAARPTLTLIGLVAIIGLGMAVKWSVVILAAVALAFFACIKKLHWAATFAVMLPAASVPYLLAYGVYFAQGHSLRDFAALQQGIAFRWHDVWAAADQAPLTIWQILVTGYCSYGDYFTSNWEWYWPAVAVGSVVAAVLAWRRKLPLLWMCVCWFLFYMLFFSWGPTWNRYLVPALPAGMIATIWVVREGRHLLRFIRGSRTAD